MARPRKNPVPAETVTAKDTAAKTVAATEAADAVETAVKELAAEAKTVKKAASKKAAGAAKTVKAEAKKTVKKAAEKAETAAEEVKQRAARTTKTDTAVIIQFEGRNIEANKVTEAAKARWVESGKKESAIKSIEVYINVTEGMAYPVINGEAQEGFYCC